MDFGFDSDSSKKPTVTSHLEKGDNNDHSLKFGDSPLHAADKMQKSTSGSGSTDDFEHVDHDPFMSDSSFPSTKAPAPGFGGGVAAGSGGGNQLLDFGIDSHITSSGAKDKAADFMASFGDKISMTRDFMAAERGGMEPPKPVQKAAAQPDFDLSARLVDPRPPVSKPVQESIFEPEPVQFEEVKQPSPVPPKREVPAPAPVQEQPPTDNFSFFDSPVKKISKEDTDKFISSEDLLGDFSDARRTPEPALPAISKPTPVVPSAPLMSEPAPAPEPIIVAAPVVEPPKPKEEPKPAPVPKVEEKPAPAAPSKVEEIVKLAAIPEPVKAPEAVKPTAPPPSKKPAKPMISAEEIFCRYGLDAWFKPDRLHPVVESLIYWRDVKKSGIVFGAGLVILLAISCFSVISVFAYLSLLSLAGTIAFRIYKNVLGAIQKTSEGHPFKEYLEMDLNISQEKAQNVVSVVVAHFNGFISELRRLFLVDDLVDSIKFGVILWVLTYIGAWFNGMTLVILAFVALFTLPKVYENNKESIDTYLDLVRSKIMEITDKVKAAIPIGKKQETDKDK